MRITRPFLPLCLMATLLISGCESTPAIPPVQMSQDDAFNLLVRADIAAFQRAQQCAGTSFEFHIVPTRASAVEWQATSGFSNVASFTVRLEAVSPTTTRTIIEIPADPQGGEMYDGTKHYERAYFQQPLRPAIQELIDSALEKRPFDAMRLLGSRVADPACSGQQSGPVVTSNTTQQPATQAPAPAATATPTIITTI